MDSHSTGMTRRLTELLKSLPTYTVEGVIPESLMVAGVTNDSRAVSAGDVFVAYPGVSVDGHRFIPDVIERGAVSVVGERERADLSVPYIRVPDAREALGWLSAAWYDHPSRELRVVGVTGTDGKTTTIELITGVLTEMEQAVGKITTIGASIGGQQLETGEHTTTPDAPDIQRYLRQMVDAGMEYAVLEVTSHGLAQQRVAGVAFDVSVVTNITHEHLDIHGSVEAYRQAKAKLFAALDVSYRKPAVPKVSVLNADDSSIAYLHTHPADVQITYGIGGDATVRANGISYTSDGSHMTVHSPLGEFSLHTNLLGSFNVYNVLAAVAVGVSQDATVAQIQAGIEGVERVRGRMDAVDLGQDFLVLVDFAHTPASLEHALQAARTMVDGRVIVVFGSAGLRDVDKRGMMGKIAGELADMAVFTAEDPRTEDVNDIIDEIAAGAREAGAVEERDFVRIPDRAEAIAWAVDYARAGDIVLTCGKGHEPTMCYGTTEYPWNEHEVVREALQRRRTTAD